MKNHLFHRKEKVIGDPGIAGTEDGQQFLCFPQSNLGQKRESRPLTVLRLWVGVMSDKEAQIHSLNV